MTERSVIQIASDLFGQFPVLIRQETRLARSEISETMTQIASSMIMAVVGAVLMIPALVIMLFAAVYGLENAGFVPWAASLIAGGGAFVVALIVLMIGIGRVRAAKLVPERTIRQIQEDASVVRRQTRETSNEFQRAA
jgi:hypothetical protein